MKTNPKTGPERQTVLEPDIDALLLSEVDFWRETIASCPACQSSESIERMHHALALAESRLAKIRAATDSLEYPASHHCH